MWLVVHQSTGGTFGTTGTTTLYRPEDASVAITLTTDADLNVVRAKGSSFNYRGRCYITGQYTDNAMVDEHFRLFRQGIRAPDVIPVLASGGGSGPAGTHIGYVSFYDSLTDEHSPLSGASAAFANGGTNQITWTNLPATSGDTRVTHIILWRSVDGGAIRFVTMRDLGVTTVTEAVATLALGEVAPDTFERFPRCGINASYHDRQFMAGDEEHPDRLYYSALFAPERWEGGFFDTRNGEPITAIVAVQDVLLVCCPTSSYILQGYTESDFTFTLSEPELGCPHHHLIQMVHGNAWIPNDKSIFIFNGAWHNAMKHGQEEWRLFHEAHCDGLALAFSVFDPVRNVYKLGVYLSPGTVPGVDIPLLTPASTQTYYWVADVVPATLELSGEMQQPNWSFDIRTRQDSAAAVLSLPGGICRAVYTGSCDGHIRRENEDDDQNDDGDTYGKRLIIRTGALHMLDPGGHSEEGKRLIRLWTHVEHGLTLEYVLLAIGGDEGAWGVQNLLLSGGPGVNVRYFYRETVEAPSSSGEQGGFDYSWTPQGTFAHVPERVTGRAFTFVILADSPGRMHFRGLGGIYGPGPATRPPSTEEVE